MGRGSLNTGEYTRSYYDIRGVELGGSGGSISKGRLARAENVWRDYDGDGRGLIESVPGYRSIGNLGAPVSTLNLYKHKYADYLIATAGTGIYRIPIADRDKGNPPEYIGSLTGEGGAAFNFLGSHYIIDGERILKIGATGTAQVLGEDESDAYCPTTYINGVRHEQRNLLSRRFKERYTLSEPSSYTYGTPVLNYVIIDNELGTCRVSGVSDVNYAGKMYIPSVTRISGREFRVTEIGKNALASCVYITELYIAEGIEKIDTYAVRHCIRLERAVLPRSVGELGGGVFSECSKLRELYLGSGIKKMGGGIIAGCESLSRVYFGANEDTFATVEAENSLGDKTVVYNVEERRVALEFPIITPCLSVSGVTENGAAVEYTPVLTGGKVSSVIFESTSAWDGTTDAVIHCEGEEYVGDFGEVGESVSGKEAITGCTVAEAFDGRIFLSGNRRLPNTVFFSAPMSDSSRSALYFGALNYFTDGVGAYRVADMLAVRDSLAVFKTGDDGAGSIYYHTPRAGEDDFMPRIYPVSYIHSGIGAVGGAVSFFDDPVFLTKSGLYALEQKAINYERSVACRSGNVNYSLLNEDLSRASVTEWCGYLVLGCAERAYLADSRATYTDDGGHLQYEWFCLSGIGHREGGTRVYRFDSRSVGEYIAHKTPGEVAEGTVYSTSLDGEMVYYIEDGGKKYTVYPTEEMRGGDFYPASCYLGADSLLFFGTTGGEVCVFNNDKRGVAPDYIAGAPDFDKEEYSLTMGRRIHPDFYSFDRYAPTYVISTAYDNCSLPHLTKSTVKHSLVVKYRTYSSADIRCEVGTDTGKYTEVASFPGGEFSFRELNFESLSMALGDYHTVPLSEKEKGWVEKQITFCSDRFCSPIGIYQITYRYTVKGRLKKK